MNIYILVGNIGTGKSTFVKHFLQEHPDVLCVSRDAIRYMIGGGKYIYKEELESYIFDVEEEMIWMLLKKGIDVIVDDVGISKRLRANYLSYADIHHYKTTALVMPRLDRKTCVDRRMRSDGRNTTREVWETVWNNFDKQYEEPTVEEGFDNIQYI